MHVLCSGCNDRHEPADCPSRSMTDIEYVMACVECGERRAWPAFLCDECGSV